MTIYILLVILTSMNSHKRDIIHVVFNSAVECEKEKNVWLEQNNQHFYVVQKKQFVNATCLEKKVKI